MSSTLPMIRTAAGCRHLALDPDPVSGPHRTIPVAQHDAVFENL
jgi:hypothetical protein